MTPMQEQYDKLKSQYKDTILLFRLGDFYEAFNGDAETLSRVLGITLTGRGKDENRIPMAGIPHHALSNYMPKMVEAGLKVAIADQMEEATPGKLVEREITRIVTPGTVIDENSLDNSKNNYIASIYKSESKTLKKILNIYSLVLCDLTTGELKAFNTENFVTLQNEIRKFSPSEILIPKTQFETMGQLNIKVDYLEDINFNFEKSFKVLIKQFGVNNLKGFGIDASKKEMVGEHGIISAAGALIEYLKECQRGEVKHIKSIKIYSYKDFMQLDSETIKNLELLYSMNNGDQTTTLYGVLNRCKNSMGQRKLRSWILTPLTNQELLQRRFDSVDFFYKERIISSNVRDLLKEIVDIERIVGRIGVGSASPKDLIALKGSLIKLFELKNLLKSQKLPERLRTLESRLRNNRLNDIVEIITTAISDDPPVVINQGGVIKTGYNNEVDSLNELKYNSKKILADIQRREVERTQINSLKISFNNVFGYYIEVTKTHLDKVPVDYIRKQTLANAERFITEELKELESRILNAEDRLLRLETELFIKIRNDIAEYSSDLLDVADSISELDVLSNFGEISRENRYTKPVLSSELGVKISNKNAIQNSLLITNGRHPVIEKLAKEFTPNSTSFKSNDCINIITGPNMSGKSTYIRQVALICLMAQIGCFVPCDEMNFTIVDRIFTRVGAGDNLSRGESTFMVEMTETANILNNATPNSLIILDEVGRGTSTYDGVAIAWSIVEFIHEKIKSKTLFATHYHELTELEDRYEGITNYNVNVDEENGKVLFTHKIIKGSANKSYGVYVAKIAGVPDGVTKRANEILERFERDSRNGKQKPSHIKKSRNSNLASQNPRTPRKIHPEQLGLI